MKKNAKRGLALLLCMLLCLSLFPTAFAEDVPAEENGIAGAAAADTDTDVLVEEEPPVEEAPAAEPPAEEAAEGDILVEDDTDDTVIEEGNEPEEPAERTDPAPNAAEQVEAFVRCCYNVILGREGEPAGVQGWVNALLSGQYPGAEIVSGFVKSAEFASKRHSDAEVVTILYSAMMDRAPDEGGYAYWLSVLNNGMSYQYVVNGFSTSYEFGRICAVYGIEPGSVMLDEARDQNPQVTAFVNRNYLYALGR